MRAIVTQAIINSFSTRVDRSLGFRGVTPELSDAEAVALMDLRGLNLRVLLEPLYYATDGKTEVKAALSEKSPSTRLRGCLFVLWKQLTDKGLETQVFDIWYVSQMERIINDIKSQLDPE